MSATRSSSDCIAAEREHEHEHEYEYEYEYEYGYEYEYEFDAITHPCRRARGLRRRRRYPTLRHDRQWAHPTRALHQGWRLGPTRWMCRWESNPTSPCSCAVRCGYMMAYGSYRERMRWSVVQFGAVHCCRCCAVKQLVDALLPTLSRRCGGNRPHTVKAHALPGALPALFVVCALTHFDCVRVRVPLWHCLLIALPVLGIA